MWYESFGTSKGPTENRSEMIRRAAEGSRAASSSSRVTSRSNASMCSGEISYPRETLMSPRTSAILSSHGRSKNVAPHRITSNARLSSTPWLTTWKNPHESHAVRTIDAQTASGSDKSTTGICTRRAEPRAMTSCEVAVAEVAREIARMRVRLALGARNPAGVADVAMPNG